MVHLCNIAKKHCYFSMLLDNLPLTCHTFDPFIFFRLSEFLTVKPEIIHISQVDKNIPPHVAYPLPYRVVCRYATRHQSQLRKIGI